MATKTLQKLRSICDKYNIEMDARKCPMWGEWIIEFIAPKGMFWNATDGIHSCFRDHTLKHAVWFLKEDLKCGFRTIDREEHWGQQ